MDKSSIQGKWMWHHTTPKDVIRASITRANILKKSSFANGENRSFVTFPVRYGHIVPVNSACDEHRYKQALAEFDLWRIK